MNTKISREQNIAKKESLLRKVVSELFLQIKINDPKLENLSINRVVLSPDKSVLYIFFHITDGEKSFKEKFSQLILYKPSLRKAIAQAVASRYVPEIVFQYDKIFEKQCKIERLLDQLKEKK